MRWSLGKAESLLLVACGLLLFTALFAPALPQPPHAHHFADRRTLLGLACAFDVVSNLPFAWAGVLGLALLGRVPRDALSPTQRACSRLFFAGLVLITFTSGWYHLAPDDIGLAIDRAGMSVAFAGLLGLLAAAGISERAGRTLGAALLVLAPVSVFTCYFTGNVLPWVLVQFGGMPLLVVLAVAGPPTGGLPVRWSLVLLAYAVAKWFEMNDAAVFQASGELLSGHTVKHVAASLAAWPVIAALRPLARRQNAPERTTATPARQPHRA
jgi:hypothetical protein